MGVFSGGGRVRPIMKTKVINLGLHYSNIIIL